MEEVIVPILFAPQGYRRARAWRKRSRRAAPPLRSSPWVILLRADPRSSKRRSALSA